MSATKSPRPVIAPNYTGPRLFGAPVGDFSFLQTLLITVATGFASFFATTFLAIMSLLIYTESTGRKVDFGIAYRWFGLPVGILMLFTAAVYLGSLLLRRLRGSAAENANVDTVK
jgi:hypothetical protein